SHPRGQRSRGAEVGRIMDAVCRLKSAGGWQQILDDAEVPCAPILNPAQVFAEPQIRMNDMIVEVVHPQAGRTLIPGVAVHFSDTPGSIRRPAPVLGQHNDEILTELGYTKEEIEGLRVAGVI